MIAEDSHISERGIALIVTLWALIIISILAAGVITSSRTTIAFAANERERARAVAAADAGISRAVLMLLDARPSTHWPVDGQAKSIKFAGFDLSISVQDERGKLDLNTANPDLLRNLFASAGLTGDQATSLLDCVLDWRDQNDLRRLNGAEKADYLNAGYRYGPRNAAFQSTSELGLVMGMKTQMLNLAQPALTIYSHTADFDIDVAPVEALHALPGMTDEAAARMVQNRRKDSTAKHNNSALLNEGALAGRAFTIISLASQENHLLVGRKAVVRISGNARDPYWVHEWSDIQSLPDGPQRSASQRIADH